jgi:hypothetical protein
VHVLHGYVASSSAVIANRWWTPVGLMSRTTAAQQPQGELLCSWHAGAFRDRLQQHAQTAATGCVLDLVVANLSCVLTGSGGPSSCQQRAGVTSNSCMSTVGASGLAVQM